MRGASGRTVDPSGPAILGEGEDRTMKSESWKETLLVLGGARSGKSSWALRYVEGAYVSPVFLATAQVLDEEMAERVRLHQETRGPVWKLLEEPLDVPQVLTSRCEGADAVLVDCLTVWLSNVMLQQGEAHVEEYQELLGDALHRSPRSVILVANEVGTGVVPEYRLGRAFRDAAGLLNQHVAALVDRVVYLTAGLPLWLKGGP